MVDPADLLSQADVNQIFSGITLDIMGMPTTRIAVLPTLDGDAQAVAQRLRAAWHFPTDFGYLLVVFPRQAKSALLVHSDAQQNGFDDRRIQPIVDKLNAALLAGRMAPGLHQTALDIMWTHEEAEANRAGTPMSAKVVRTFGQHPLAFALVVLAVLGFLALFCIPSLRLLLYQRWIRS